MGYTVKQLAQLTGVSARTLRYYDQIGLLTPMRITQNGYRVYGSKEVDLLQQILFFKEVGMPLREIQQAVFDPEFSKMESLRAHRRKLLKEKQRIEALIQTVERTIICAEKGTTMSDLQKFEGFKRELIQKNEAQYGEEIREKYGADMVDASNAKLMGLSPEQYEQMEKDSLRILELLDAAYEEGDFTGETARKLVEFHRHWLGYTWSEYSPAAHQGLGEMYAADERFAAYFDRGTPGKAAFFRDAINCYFQ